MPNIENVRDEPITTGPQADQVEPHERGAEAIAQTAYRTDRYFSQVAGDIKGLAQPGAAYVENLTRAQAATSMATESQTDMQAMEGAKKAFADDIQSDTHDPQLAMNLRNTYAKVVQAGATGFSTQEGKEQYLSRADSRLKAYSEHLVNLEGQAASAQSVIDFSRHEDGLVGQAQMGGTAILPSLDQQITAFTSNLNNSTPEAAAANAEHGRALGLKVSMAAVESDLNALPADQDPMAAAEKIIAGDPTRFAPLANEIRQAAKGVLAERRSDTLLQQQANETKMRTDISNFDQQAFNSDGTLNPKFDATGTLDAMTKAYGGLPGAPAEIDQRRKAIATALDDVQNGVARVDDQQTRMSLYSRIGSGLTDTEVWAAQGQGKITQKTGEALRGQIAGINADPALAEMKKGTSISIAKYAATLVPHGQGTMQLAAAMAAGQTVDPSVVMASGAGAQNAADFMAFYYSHLADMIDKVGPVKAYQEALDPRSGDSAAHYVQIWQNPALQRGTPVAQAMAFWHGWHSEVGPTPHPGGPAPIVVPGT